MTIQTPPPAATATTLAELCAWIDNAPANTTRGPEADNTGAIGAYPMPIKGTRDGCIAIRVYPDGSTVQRSNPTTGEWEPFNWIVQYTPDGMSPRLRQKQGCARTTRYHLGELLTDQEMTSADWFDLNATKAAR